MITQGCVAFSMEKKFLSLEKFYTNIVTGVSDYYQVWVQGFSQRCKVESVKLYE